MQDPVVYNDSIVDVLGAADTAYGNYATYAQETSNTYVDKIEENRLNAVSAQQGYLDQLNAMSDLDGDASLRDGAITYVTINKELLENQEKALVDLRTEANNTPDEEWTDAVEADFVDKQNTIYDEIDTIITAQENDFENLQIQFAAKNGYELEETIDNSVVTE